MIKKYKTNRSLNSIETVDVERETKVSVWIDGRRQEKHTTHDHYYDTWREAHDYLLGVSSNIVDSYRSRLEQAKGRLGNTKGMKPPVEKED